jgi:predicted lipoprotein with Yx(FWY)xxD motif
VRTAIILAATAALALGACRGAEQDVATNVEGNQATPADQQLPGGGAVSPLGAAVIQVAAKDPYGQYLVDGSGRTVYVLEGSRMQAQQQGQQSQSRAQCTGECLSEWPPVLTEGAPTAGQGVDAAQLSTTPIENAQQVTYAGWPLYHYRGDRGAGSTAGQEVHDRWGGWYLVSPQGERIEGREMGPSAE